jgi:alpha-mannosidase
MPNFEAERRIEADQIRVRLAEIEETIYTLRQPIGGLQACVTGPGKGPERAPKSGWKPFEVHDRWGGFDQTTWFKMTVKVPAAMKGHRVVVFIRPGGESLAFVNGKPTQGLDNNRDEIYLTEKARGGETFDIAIESVPSTRFDEYHNFAYADIAVMHPQVWDFYWDCTSVLEVWQELDPEFAPRRQLMELLAASVKMADLQHKSSPSYFESIAKAQRHLRKGLKDFETSYGVGRLTMNGHSHIDTAWLWPLRETQRKCGRTFSTVLDLMDRYPDYHFSCSQAAQYDIVKEHFPELYRRIKQRVKEGRWEPTGGMYVEPDLNVPSGESLVRQVLYGKRFFRKEFGVDCRVGWTPDTFGYCWALPQILSKAGFDAFVTMKLRWGNQFTDFPYNFFQWEGCDGTRLTTLMPDGYNNDIRPDQLVKQWRVFKQKEKVEESLFCYGWGDGGGGPTMKMLEHGKRVKNIVGVPKSEFGTVQECLDRMRSQCDPDTLPVWNGELYFELHRGCQTSQARTKKNNRKSELLLRRTEFLSILAMLNGGKYDHKTLSDCWRGVLLNQFHDILPGTSLNEVYKTCDEQYAALQETAGGVLDKAIAFLASKTDTSGDGTPLLAINTQSWVRTGVAEAVVKLPRDNFRVLDPAGEPVPAQRIGRDRVLFEAHNLPPMVMRCIAWFPARAQPRPACSRPPNAAWRTSASASSSTGTVH